jgi:hypothetical protein
MPQQPLGVDDDQLPLGRGCDGQADGRSVAREVWVAAGLSADAVDIVLAKVPEGWAAHRSFESLSLEQIATLHLREGDARELAY